MNPAPQLENAMRRAINEARFWLGATTPNPPVGAVALDADGRIVDVAAHRHTGEAHAEALLIQQLRQSDKLEQAKTLCVTLEPCNHHGRTPPCTETIIASGIKNVVIGTRDPNPHVTGGGVERLQAAGIHVTVGILENDCRQLFHAFAYHAATGKPWITVKRAYNHAGSMIPPVGQKTFTSAESLRLAHRLRKKADAILCGSGTILADAPMFTVRHVQDHPGKRRHLAILDRRQRVSDTIMKRYEANGFIPRRFKDVGEAIATLEKCGVQDILAETGPTTSDLLLDLGLWNMSVTVRQGENADDVDVAFNAQHPLPFDPQQWSWDCLLPQDHHVAAATGNFAATDTFR